MAQHGTAQHSTAQHSTAQHSTAQHSTAGALPDAVTGHAWYPCAYLVISFSFLLIFLLTIYLLTRRPTIQYLQCMHTSIQLDSISNYTNKTERGRDCIVQQGRIKQARARANRQRHKTAAMTQKKDMFNHWTATVACGDRAFGRAPRPQNTSLLYFFCFALWEKMSMHHCCLISVKACQCGLSALRISDQYHQVQQVMYGPNVLLMHPQGKPNILHPWAFLKYC